MKTNLKEALELTGCAIFVEDDCITSVERLTDNKFLLMTRRGVCILLCLLVDWDYLTKIYPGYGWNSARVQFA